MPESNTPATLTLEGVSELSHETTESNERAVALFKRALERNDVFPAAYGGLAQAYLQRADDLGMGLAWLEPAAAAANRAIELDQSDGDAYQVLGRVYRIKGWLTKELEVWQQRLRVTPDDPVASARLGWVLWFTGRAEESLPWLRTAAALQPNNRWVQFYIGNANLAIGDYRQSTESYRRALLVDPQHSSAQAGVIWSHLAAGQDDEAWAELRNFQHRPFDGDRYLLKLADIEHFLGENERAMVHAKQSLAESEERYWPRGFLASTILGAAVWSQDRSAAEESFNQSERIDHARLQGGDEGYMPHIDLAAIESVRGDFRAARDSVRAAIAAGWRYGAIAVRDRLFANLRTEPDFVRLVESR